MKLTERHGGSALASRRIRHGRPIASELSVLILAIMVVYGVAAVALVIVKVEQAEDATRELAKFRAELAAGEIADAVEVATTTIGDSAASPGALAALASPPDDCSLQFALAPFQQARLDLVTASGRTICSSVDATGARNQGDTSWIDHDAGVTTSWSDPYTDPVTGLTAIAIAAPVFAIDGGIAGYVAAVLPVSTLADELGSRLGRPAGYKFAVIDGGGSLVSSAAGSTDSAAEPFGSGFVSASTPVARTNWSVVAGLQRSDAVATVVDALSWSVGLGAGALLLMLALVYFVNVRIGRPIIQLTKAVSRSHDTGVSVIDMRGPAEVRQLANEFSELIAARDAAADALANRALRDPLTGLTNRAALAERLTITLDRYRAGSEGFALTLVDIDRFKLINDSFGHSVGDEALLAVAGRLQRLLGPADTLARIGGDQFVVVSPNASDRESCERMAARLMAAIEEPLQLADTVVVLTASVGVAIADHDATAESLLCHADLAATEAKGHGRGRYHVFDRLLDSPAGNVLVLETELRHAIERGEMWVAYQPIASASGGSCNGVESLLRWDHPGMGPVSPVQFIPAAEASGLIIPIGAFVLDQACRQLAEWNRTGLDVVVSINVSARQIEDGRILRQISEAVTAHGVDPHSLCVELTEGLLMADPAVSAEVLRELKALGVQISLDDFGTGYSSLAYLHLFPVDELKIDRSFIIDLATSADTRTLVNAIIAMSHALGLRVVAEGVEDNDQLRVLQELDCDLVQGFLFQRPDRPNAVARHLNSHLPTG